MAHQKRLIVVYLLIAAMILALAGCSSGQTASLAKSGILTAAHPAASGKKEMLDYLKASRNDLALIDQILADKEIGLLDESDSSETVTKDKLANYESILQGYSEQIQTVLNDIDTRPTPNHPEVAKFKSAETAAFQTLDSILNEYNQVLIYAGVVMDVSDDLSSLSKIKESSLQAVYNDYSAKIKDAIQKLKDSKAPSFLESTNSDFIDALQQMDSAVLYALNAAAMDDPVRADSAEYRMGILSRYLDTISKEWDQNLSDRQAKLREDSLAVQKTVKGLKNWLNTNISALGG